MKYFKLAYLVGLRFTCETTKEFKNSFFYVNIHGQSPAFPAVASNVFFTLASQDSFKNEI